MTSNKSGYSEAFVWIWLPEATEPVVAEIIRHKFANVSATLKELFSRLVFNILSGNTDDHARNHTAFWDGQMLKLTPAYDICPQARSGKEASQAMLISGDNRMSRISACLEAAHHFPALRERGGGDRKGSDFCNRRKLERRL